MDNQEKKCQFGSKKLVGILYFLAIAAVTTMAVVVTVTEGNRIRRENELLSYEVW
jgi:hypothetical protein